jgi:hypothetical protein
MSGKYGLEQLAVHAIVVDNQKFDHISASQAGMSGARSQDAG